ncbi:secreted RxLR effector protein 161-like [Stegodyphus dumicola]|uniref:secreted RxLR effector protein 161-like n=1 Tax=Stegodyphus dumicola TaxID=202533 RepID=UPI0015B34E0B|nr:secreted RxLR effector protein 161-like [Stegodyphus dumicola]
METNYCKLETEDGLLEDNAQYRQAVGALLYIATTSRPDIACAVNLLSKRNEKPRNIDWNAVKKVIRSLYTTKDFELVFKKIQEPILTAYSDADWANDRTTRKSISGYIFKLLNNCISWSSKRQNCIALSSTEAEYIAAANTAQEAQWLLNLLKDLGLKSAVYSL